MEATKRSSQKQSFFYHHSCHGQTTLHNLLVDKDRPQKYIIHKYLGSIFPKDKEFFDLSYSQMLAFLKTKGYHKGELDELFLKHNAELESIPYVDPIIGVPEGLSVEIHLKIRGEQGQVVETDIDKDFSADPKNVEFKPRQYHDYIVMKVIGYPGNIGHVHQVYTKFGKRKDIFFDVDKRIVINLPNIEFYYIADFEVGLLEIVKDDDGKSVVVADDDDNPIRYTGCSYTMEREGYFHSYSNEKTDESLLNALFNGTTKPVLKSAKATGSPWSNTKHIQYPGILKDIDPDANKLLINIHGSHCLSPQEFSDHGSIGNVIPFMIDSCPQWAEIFKSELVTAASMEVDFQEDVLDEQFDKLSDLDDMIRNLKSTKAKDFKSLASKPMKESSVRKYEASVSKINSRINMTDKRIEELDDEMLGILDEIEEKEERVEKAKKVEKAVRKLDQMDLGPVQNSKRNRGALTRKKKKKKKKN
tara:strand:- start:93 stop:1514 length:1422 start_codon:yes stop_codon:yes gene_type:complete